MMRVCGRARRGVWPLLALTVALSAAGPVSAQDGLLETLGLDGLFGEETPPENAYEADIDGAPSEAIEAQLEESLLIFRLRPNGAPSLALLRRRAEEDIETAQKILRAEGYYGAEVAVSVTPAEGAEPGAVKDATARLTITPGDVYTLAAHEILVSPAARDGAVERRNGAEYGAPVSQPARAADILAAEQAALDQLHGNGRPYARRVDRIATADPDNATLSVTTRIEGGGAYVFGETRLVGGESVDHGFVRSYQPWTKGETVDLAKLDAYQRALARTGLFAAVSAAPPEEAPAAENGPAEMPVTVRLEPAPFRSVGLGARYSTDLGPSARISFEHRNLFGAGEKLDARLEGGETRQALTLDFRKPQFMRDQQDLIGGIEIRNQDLDAYEERAVTASIGLERQIAPRWRASAGLLGETSRVDDDGQEETALLLGLPVVAEYDASNDLLNPTDGERLRLSATPMGGEFNDQAIGFLTLDASGSIYRPIIGSDRLVLAARARLASLVGEELRNVPGPRRLYAGGGGSVRGYAQQSIGPLDDNDDPVGGRSALELGAELRIKATEEIGIVLFVDAGAVTEDVFPSFDEDIQVAVGPGLRYYSPIGPLRVDVGVPLDKRRSDDPFQLYFSIGQAF